MRAALLGLCALLAALTLGCGQEPAPPVAPSSADPLPALLEKARQAREGGDWERAALALREAVDLLGQRPPSPLLEKTRDACTEAMVLAGGNVESYLLWSELEQKHGGSPETSRMKSRARKLILQQARELGAQAQVDQQQGRPQSALCTARASLSLFERVAASPQEIAAGQAAVTRHEQAVGDSAAR